MEVAVAEGKRIRELEAALKKARIENDLCWVGSRG